MKKMILMIIIKNNKIWKIVEIKQKILDLTKIIIMINKAMMIFCIRNNKNLIINFNMKIKRNKNKFNNRIIKIRINLNRYLRVPKNS